MQEQTVFIVDDDAAVRDSIQELVESVGLHAQAYDSGQAFLDDFQQQRPGCLVLDVRMANMSGLALQEKLNELDAGVPVIIITGHGDVPMAVRALQAGAADFIQKPYRDQLLLDSINNALAVDAAARRSSTGSDDLVKQLETLTKREREILDMLVDGKRSKDIARALGISPRTVEAHRQNTLRKMEVSSVKELIFNKFLQEKGK
jgi:two-component system response regulator DctR